MMEQKRSPVSIEQSSLTSLTPKRHKGDLSLSSKERKEKLGERIAALQQLVSPYGKTDTASVLWDAMEYINFLHEQVKVLSAPYLHSTSTDKLEVTSSSPGNSLFADMQGEDCVQGLPPPNPSKAESLRNGELESYYSLRSKGLCLVPVSYTIGVASCNGADIWAPIKTNSPKF